jgi:uncharacterized membrane protein YcaP (DUF421 family)
LQQITEMLALTRPVLDTAIRSTVAFLLLVALIRIVPKRNTGRISPNDMLILIIVGTMGADAITGGSESVGDLLLMTVMVLAWGYVLDLLEFHFPFVRRLMRHEQTLLIKDGRYLRKNMRRELVTEEEMLSVMRTEGIKSVSEVSAAVLEADGEISILKRGGGRDETLPGGSA